MHGATGKASGDKTDRHDIEIAGLLLDFFISAMADQRSDDPYTEGYEAALREITENDKDIIFFKKRYRQGYLQGSLDAGK